MEGYLNLNNDHNPDITHKISLAKFSKFGILADMQY